MKSQYNCTRTSCFTGTFVNVLNRAHRGNVGQRLDEFADMSGEKKYGLIIPARKKAGATGGRPVAKPSVFGDSSSDEEVWQHMVRYHQ